MSTFVIYFLYPNEMSPCYLRFVAQKRRQLRRIDQLIFEECYAVAYCPETGFITGFSNGGDGGVGGVICSWKLVRRK
jgi:hypothetical protein